MHLGGNDIADYPIAYAIEWTDGRPTVRLRELDQEPPRRRRDEGAWVTAALSSPHADDPNVSGLARWLAATVGDRSEETYRKAIGRRLRFDDTAGVWVAK